MSKGDTLSGRSFWKTPWQHVSHVDGQHRMPSVDVHRLLGSPIVTMEMAFAMARKSAVFDVDTIIGYGHQGLILAFGCAHALSKMMGRDVAAAAEVVAPREIIGTIRGSRALGIDVDTDNGSRIQRFVEVAADARLELAGVVVITNSTGLTAEALGVPKLCVLIDKRFVWAPDDCPFCKPDQARLLT